MTHAGFWVDGAVRKPEARHCNAHGEVMYRLKRRDGGCDDRVFQNGIEWVNNDCFWLDTTPRESLTPEELFSVLRLLWPDVMKVIAFSNDCWYVNDGATHTPITWNGATQYPPPTEPQWIRITRENVGQYLFRDCRFRDSDSQEWRNGKVAGWCETDHSCLVNSDFNDDLFVMQWNIVEVQNAPTS